VIAILFGKLYNCNLFIEIQLSRNLFGEKTEKAPKKSKYLQRKINSHLFYYFWSDENKVVGHIIAFCFHDGDFSRDVSASPS
jgi:hypothetical protein